MDSEELKNLEHRVDQLIHACQQLRHENRLLQSEHENIAQKYNRLVEKTRTARTRIENMIGRLKSLERST